MRVGRLDGARRGLRACGVLALVSMTIAAAGTGTACADPAAKPASATSATLKGGPLTVWLGGILAQSTPGSAYRKWYDRQIAEFTKKHPGTKVKTILLDPDGVKQTAQYRTAFGGGQHIDLAMMYPGGFTTEFGSSLTDLRKAAPAVLKQFTPQALQFGCDKFDCSKNAPQYIAPFDVSGWILAYNKKIFAKAGVKAPFKNWDALIAGGKKLKAAGYVPFQMGNRDGYVADAYLSNMESSYLGANDIGSVLAGRLKLTDAKFVGPLQKWADLYEQGLVNENACSLETLASQRDFYAGKAATVATYDYANMYKQMKANLGVMTWPSVNGAPNASHGGPASQVGQGWVVPKGASNAPLALALLAQLTSAKAQTSQFAIAGIPPANTKASTATAPDPGTAQSAKLFQHATVLSLDAALPLRTQTAYFKETNLALCGKKSPEDAMKAVQSILAREIK